MRLASNHVFLIRCTTQDETVDTVLRFDSSFFKHLLVLATSIGMFELRTHHLLIGLLGTFSVVDSVGSEGYHQVEADLSNMEEKLALATFDSERQDVEANLRHLRNKLTEISQLRRALSKAHLRVFVEVSEMKAGGDPRLPPKLREQNANEDKMSIVLNTIASGISYIRTSGAQGKDRPSTVDECCRQMLLLALAKHDPISLCTTGQPLQLGGDAASKSWLTWPDMDDNQPNLPPMPVPDILVDPSYMTQYIRLDLLFLGGKEGHRTASAPQLSVAKQILLQFSKINLDARARVRFRDYGSGRNKILMEREAQTLACMLDCGEAWISLASRTCGYDRDNALQELLPFFFEQIRAVRGRNDLHWMETTAGTAAATIMLDFTSNVTLRGIPRFAIHDEAWRPVLVDVEENSPALVFSPSSPQDQRPVDLAVPIAVLADAYASLSRVWILGHRPDRIYELLGKVRMFGGASIARTRNDKWQRRDKQVVYGP